MKTVALFAAVCICASAHVAAAGAISRETAEQVRQAEERLTKTATGKQQEFARELLDAARSSIAAATAAATTGNEREARQKSELASLQLNAADARAAERELLEQVAVRRSELKKLEAQLERYRQGEGF